ncbi:YL1 nuclear protein-domain-containing protein [Aspergillus egyptiacus]|nr:YL1 nuclear protein-domain-containing protein [Aspergillus egyptiacus]
MAQDDDMSSSEDGAPVESLIQGRAKRSTAGRHMSALLDAEADDELALLFEEIEDDNEFAVDAGEEGGEEDDMGLDSSSDDEDDQGPNAQADDLEGERQIEKEEREERKKRRAREDLRYRITSKKVKIDPTAAAVPTTPAPRPRKKSERVSWIPTPEEGPTRSSSRRQTMQNKELTHARLKDSEEKRIRLIATMEEAAKRKAKLKPKEMTQAEHLAEAERVEKLNSKSLNRWEEMEKRKAEERRAKIEALQNRRLEGPVISYWSGVATWVDGRLTRVGKVNITPKQEKEEGARKKSKKSEKEAKGETERKSINPIEPSVLSSAPPTVPSGDPTDPASSTGPKPDQDPAPPPQQEPVKAGQVKNVEGEALVSSETNNRPSTAAEAPLPASSPSILPDPETAHNTIQGVLERNDQNQIPGQEAVVTGNGTAEETTDGPTGKDAAQQRAGPPIVKDSNPAENAADAGVSPKAGEKASDLPREPVGHSPAAAQTTSEPNAILPLEAQIPAQLDGRPDGQVESQDPVHTEQRPDIHVDQPTAGSTSSLQPTTPPRPSVVEQTGRCLTVLENFDEKTAQSREFNIYFNSKKPPRLTKISSSLCVITSLPSRYRDPDTSLPFANSYAYHEIRHTASHKYSWSAMFGCYVGPAGIAARGVPERFLNPNAKERSAKTSGAVEEANTSGKDGETAKSVGNSTVSTPVTPVPTAAPPAPTPAGAGDAMDVDK